MGPWVHGYSRIRNKLAPGQEKHVRLASLRKVLHRHDEYCGVSFPSIVPDTIIQADGKDVTIPRLKR